MAWASTTAVVVPSPLVSSAVWAARRMSLQAEIEDRIAHLFQLIRDGGAVVGHARGTQAARVRHVATARSERGPDEVGGKVYARSQCLASGRANANELRPRGANGCDRFGPPRDPGLAEDRQQVALRNDEKVCFIDSNFGARVLGEQHPVALPSRRLRSRCHRRTRGRGLPPPPRPPWASLWRYPASTSPLFVFSSRLSGRMRMRSPIGRDFGRHFSHSVLLRTIRLRTGAGPRERACLV